MKRFLVLLCLLATGCSVNDLNLDLNNLWGQPHGIKRNFHDPAKKQYPQCNLPRSMRQCNWVGPLGEGSCVHASWVMALRLQNRPKTADWWRAHHSDGEWAEDLAAKLDRAGIRYAYTSKKNDVAFLDKALKTHRACGVTVMGGRHMILLIHLDDKWAGLIDNNAPEVIKWVPRKTFLAEWKNSSSWAVVPLYTPAPSRVPRI